MLQRTNIKPTDPAAYGPFVTAKSFETLQKSSDRLAGKRILQLSATRGGGGVAEMLRGVIALERGLGLDVTWQTIDPPAGFFEITKQIHNGLQGETVGIGESEWRRYESVNRKLAAEIDPDRWDLIIVHDPQPAAIRSCFPAETHAQWIWRCHLDLSAPNPAVAKRMLPLLKPYDGVIYSMEHYRLNGLKPKHPAVIPPVIDPLAPKNRPMEPAEADRIVARYGIDPATPLLTQVSRFDRWKDPVGVIAAWKLARRQVPNLQLALVGNTVNDDPESGQVLAEVKQAAEGESDVFIIENIPPPQNDRHVKAFYVASDVVMQKSVREGFGLTVSEALWAGTPVVAGQVGGIVLQVESGRTGYLVSTVDGAAEATVQLLLDPKLAAKMGRAGRGYVRKHFLLPRLVSDEMRFGAGILNV